MASDSQGERQSPSKKKAVAQSLGAENEKVDPIVDSRVAQPSLADGLDQPRTPARERLSSTPGSKYTPLLKVDRQESMRGFTLKLVASDSVDTTPRSSLIPDAHGQSGFARQETSGTAELRNRSQSMHVLIPPKEEKTEIEKVYINKFHETVDQKVYHVKRLFLLVIDRMYFLS